MKTKKRQKLCYNCEGEVDLDVIVCPFCAADLRVEKPEVQRPTYDPNLHTKNLNTQQSLYPPHYSPRVDTDEETFQEELQDEEEEPQYPQEEEAIGSSEDWESKSTFGPMILLTLGMQLLLFGVFMLFFSHNGVITFQLDARLWFFYILAAVPLLIFGYKSISKT